VLAAAAALCAVVTLPGQAWASGEPGPYAFEPGARPVSGAATTNDAKRLDAGATYRDSIGPGEKRFYRVLLDDEKNAYVSAVAVPGLGTTVARGDGIKVSLQNGDGVDCSSNDAQFGSAAEFPRPLAAYAYRVINRNRYPCQEPGPYYAVVERTSDVTSTPERWGLEIRHVTEPGLTSAGPTRAPEIWPSASPQPLGDDPRPRQGGTSFYDAKGVAMGGWTAEIDPGESLFYRVPVDWGQQLFATVELGSSQGTGYVGGALSVALYNPARGLVGTSNPVSYDGRQKTASLDPRPPVAYENRFDPASGDKDMRFAGWYYLRVSLNPQVGGKFGERPYGLTLWLDVTNKAKSGPAYAAAPGEFAVTGDDREQARAGRSRPESAKNGTMLMVAAAGIGAGTVLVLGLGAWTLVARRHAASGPGQRPDITTGQYGPPSAG
jgi:hypothetical protein